MIYSNDKEPKFPSSVGIIPVSWFKPKDLYYFFLNCSPENK